MDVNTYKSAMTVPGPGAFGFDRLAQLLAAGRPPSSVRPAASRSAAASRPHSSRISTRTPRSRCSHAPTRARSICATPYGTGSRAAP